MESYKQCPDCGRIETEEEWKKAHPQGAWVHYCWMCWPRHREKGPWAVVLPIADPLLLAVLRVVQSTDEQA